MNANHPWDGKIRDYAVVTNSGLKVDRFIGETEARGFARQCGRSIAIVYGPGLRNRISAVLDGEEMTPAEFDMRREPAHPRSDLESCCRCSFWHLGKPCQSRTATSESGGS